MSEVTLGMGGFWTGWEVKVPNVYPIGFHDFISRFNRCALKSESILKHILHVKPATCENIHPSIAHIIPSCHYINDPTTGCLYEYCPMCGTSLAPVAIRYKVS
jgi:hypothetical protein